MGANERLYAARRTASAQTEEDTFSLTRPGKTSKINFRESAFTYEEHEERPIRPSFATIRPHVTRGRARLEIQELPRDMTVIAV